jgi:hypothetical protein
MENAGPAAVWKNTYSRFDGWKYADATLIFVSAILANYLV